MLDLNELKPTLRSGLSGTRHGRLSVNDKIVGSSSFVSPGTENCVVKEETISGNVRESGPISTQPKTVSRPRRDRFLRRGNVKVSLHSRSDMKVASDPESTKAWAG